MELLRAKLVSRRMDCLKAKILMFLNNHTQLHFLAIGASICMAV